jgi:hypothetical protein
MGLAMATHFEEPFAYNADPVREISAHHLRLGALGALGVFWAVVGVCLWAVL